ncbi:hypothetical protein N1027_17195 [Herbiconiux sp. CPCC 205763]|uniref:Lipoprotein n=1 Tax=Herbiconiux aconitum TaxID=2970913 RepID=A0ABT2GUN2_9MICO|nr:hypothetical protein [Herbiconiux aconitum]MCS5719868.1 hypothetical protein [Herbiconiux aconitum]
MARRLRILFVAGAVAVLLTGCSPVQQGQIGITRDAQGGIVALFETCSESIDLVVIAGKAVLRGDPDVDLHRWDFDGPVAPLPFLDDFGLDPDTRYVLDASAIDPGWGWSANERKNLGSVWFDAQDLDLLNPDTVLFGDPEHHGATLVTTPERFRSIACPVD